MTKYGLIFIWLILFIMGLNCCLDFISAPDTLLNIAGALGLVALVMLSVLTKCLTVSIKEKKDD
jgi:hypothetical protein